MKNMITILFWLFVFFMVPVGAQADDIDTVKSVIQYNYEEQIKNFPQEKFICI